jgi:Fur family ferric uptake transcriptional regulator
MDNATQLQDKGIEPTDKRVEIYSLFSNSPTPLSATAVLTCMKIGSVHRATIFRAIKLFEDKGLIKRVDFMEGEYRYELSSLPHHHHAVCKTCGAVEAVETCIVEELKKKLKRQNGFHVIDHSFELFGVCKKCTALV